MAYAIVRHEKIRGAEMFNGYAAEADRSIVGNNVHKNLSHKNIFIQKSVYKNYDEFVQVKKDELTKVRKEVNAWNRLHPDNKKIVPRFPSKKTNKKTKKKEDPALSQQFIFIYSYGALSEEDGIKYLYLADKFIREWFPDNEIISSIIHLDEKVPHIHIDVAYWDINKKKFNQKELSAYSKNDDGEKIGGFKTDIDYIRDEFQRLVADKFGLEKQDGSVVNPDDHERRADIAKDKLKEANRQLKEKVYSDTHTKRTRKGKRVKATNEEVVKSLSGKLSQKVKEVEELKSLPAKIEIKEVENPLNVEMKKEIDLLKTKLEEKSTLALPKERKEVKTAPENKNKIETLENEVTFLKKELSKFKRLVKDMIHYIGWRHVKNTGELRIELNKPYEIDPKEDPMPHDIEPDQKELLNKPNLGMMVDDIVCDEFMPGKL